MEHVAAMLLILGCADGAVDCAAVQDRLPQFETAQACKSEMVNEMRTFVGTHEIVLAQCVPVDPAFDTGWDLSWSVTSHGAINATAVPLTASSPIRIASR